jgi:hypothetical protein
VSGSRLIKKKLTLASLHSINRDHHPHNPLHATAKLWNYVFLYPFGFRFLAAIFSLHRFFLLVFVAFCNLLQTVKTRVSVMKEI